MTKNDNQPFDFYNFISWQSIHVETWKQISNSIRVKAQLL